MMIEGGELTPDCNFEVDWSNYEGNSIKNEEDLFKILKEFLWHRCDEDVETYLIRRKDENIRTGLPQEGKMILDMDLNNFVNYEIDAGGSE